ncbi:MAG: hypothetical protein KDE58_06870, partial [Caldilineaceae bacterium]|nr:hypothetical protein [Caldilineaceae bacterium]
SLGWVKRLQGVDQDAALAEIMAIQPNGQLASRVNGQVNGNGSSSGNENGTEETDQSPLQLTERQMTIAYQVLKEITARLQFMVNVGLDYLTLNRTAVTLSGGESQRIRLAT